MNSLHISSLSTTNDEYLNQCAPSVKCDPYAKYRSINGSCNNLKIPTWGASNTSFLRMLNANYSDGKIIILLKTKAHITKTVKPINIEIFF